MFPTFSPIWCCLPEGVRNVFDGVAIFMDLACIGIAISNFDIFWLANVGSTHTAYYDWFVDEFFEGVIDCGTEELPLPEYSTNSGLWLEFLAFRFSVDHDCGTPCPYESGFFELPT